MVVKLEFFVCIWVSQSPLVCSLGLSPISVGFWTTLSPNVALDFVMSADINDGSQKLPGYECSLFFYRLQSYYRHGDAAPKRVGAGETGMSPSEKQIRSGHATTSRPNGVAAPHDVDAFNFYDALTVFINQFFCLTSCIISLSH